MNRKEVLTEANKLVSNGLRKAAIDLLQEYLEIDPNSPTILSSLGRAYLLDQQPEKAVVYLKRSLEISQGHDSAQKTNTKYESEAFDDDDMAFVESEVDISNQTEFSLEIEDSERETTGTRDSKCPFIRCIIFSR